ncbi:hypothetical protein G7Y89_g14934 [Cudoniella acicularis]|uniref:Uncharacterized protein n=1 Tax=Cudoniella acicularis TaxID=354080 RepID=A0A8H4QX89_9HELO|nr:hypothetical protein G7Y89_g14934 [Cudoniella acicularis]
MAGAAAELDTADQLKMTDIDLVGEIQNRGIDSASETGEPINITTLIPEIQLMIHEILTPTASSSAVVERWTGLFAPGEVVQSVGE